MATPSYWKELQTTVPSSNGNNYASNASKVTLTSALQQIGRSGLRGIERDSLSLDDSMYRGGQTIAQKIFSRPMWLPDKKTVVMEKSRLVDMLAELADLTDSEKAKLSTYFAGEPIRLPYSQTGVILAQHQIKPGPENKGTVIDLEHYVLTKVDTAIVAFSAPVAPAPVASTPVSK